jgi:hypothetical protein
MAKDKELLLNESELLDALMKAGREVTIRDLYLAIERALLAKAIPIIEHQTLEEVFGEIEEQKLIKEHYGHKKGEVVLVSCARCTYEHYKAKKLEQKGG